MAVRVFRITRFKNQFPVFEDSTKYNDLSIQRAGNEALRYITDPIFGMPMEDEKDREYALFLLAAHILLLNSSTNDDTANGEPTSGGMLFKSTVGSVQVEHTKPNSFTQDELTFWLSQTEYGRRLDAFLEFKTPPFVFDSTPRDSIRVLV